jgi:hypothetical protein
MTKAKFFPVIITGAFFFSIAIAGCNGNGDSKDTKDTLTVKTTDTTKMMAPKDTMKMDTIKMDTSMKSKNKPVVNP